MKSKWLWPLVAVLCLVLAALSMWGLPGPGPSIERIQKAGSIRMGVRDGSGALSYALGDGRYGGFHVELCQRIVAKLEQRLGQRLRIEYLPVTSKNRITLLQNGSIDIECGSTTNNLARQQEVAFAVTTYVEEVRMAVRKDAGIRSIADLKNKSVATTSGSTSAQLLRKHERALGLHMRELYGKDHADSFRLLAQGRADAFVMDSSILAAQIASSAQGEQFTITGEVLSVEPIAIMLRKGDPAFKQLADQTIAELAQTGALAQLYDKWFVQAPPAHKQRLGLPLNAATRAAWAEPNDRPAEAYQATQASGL